MRHLQSTIAKLVLISLGIIPASAFRFCETEARLMHAQEPGTVKLAALEILQTKCNTCHKRQNPGKVFTLENMSGLAPKIHQQVFVWKRMPRGNISLSDAQYEALKKWLSTEKQ